MKKQIKVCLLIVCAIMTLTGLTTMVACKKPGSTSGVCVHAWQNATCLTPNVCTKCGKTRGEPLGHDFVGDTCLRCGEKKSTPLAPTEGLEYELNEDGKSYALMGLGSAKDETIIIPESYKGLPVTVIGESAFNFEEKDFDVTIKTIIIPDSVVLIKERAFSLCLDLEYLKLPDSELVLEDMAILGLVKLKSVFIPERVKKIGKGNFVACGLENITIDANNANYYVKNNCIIEKSTKTLLAAGKNATIPDDGSVTIIESYAFSIDQSLKKLVIPNGVTKINNSAFTNCMNLYSVVFADTIETVEDQAFLGCENLLSVTFGKNLKSIHQDAFYNCDKIIEVINNSSLKVVSADSGEFVSAYSSDPEDIKINARIIKTGGASEIINIDDYLFFEYENVMCLVAYVGGESELYLPESCNGKSYFVIGRFYSRFINLTMLKLFGIEAITKIVMSDGVTSIEEGAFASSSSLLSIVIGKNVTSIGAYAFSDCYKLVEVINYSDLAIEQGSSDYGEVAYYALNVKQSGTSDIVNKDGYLFYTGSNKNNYLIGYIGKQTNLVLPNDYNGKPYEINSFAFYWCDGLTSVTIPSSVTTIGESAFYGCDGLTSVTIPSSVTSIGERAFYYCDSLTSVTIPSSVTTIGESAFYGCDGLTSVTIPSSVTTIGESAFYGCDGLTSVTIPSSVTSIGENAFYGCDSLTSITIPSSVTSIGDYAFNGCNKLVEVINYSSLNITKGSTDYGRIGENALNVKTSGTTDIVNKDGYLFYTYNNVNYLLGYSGTDTNLVLPDSYNGQSYKIYNYAFRWCSGLTSVVIPNSVTSIGDAAFLGCRGLTSVVIPNSVTSIGNSAFWNCSRLTNVVIGNSVTSIGDYAFADCYGLTSVVIGNSVTTIGSSAFEGCSGLTSIVIPDSVTLIGDGAFYGCDSLTSVVFKNTKNWVWNKSEQIDSALLADAQKAAQMLTWWETSYKTWSVYISPIIDDGATQGLLYTLNDDGESYSCSGYGIATDSIVTISSTYNGLPVTAISESAFSDNRKIVSIVIPNSITSIGENAFWYSDKLVEVINYSSLNITKGSSNYGDIGYYALNVKTSGTTDIVNKNGYLFYTYDNTNYLLGYSGTDTELVLPDSYNGQSYQIYEYAFEDCSGLTSIEIPYGVVSIGESAFSYCNNLTNVTIPESVIYIAQNAFYAHNNLTITFTYENEYPWFVVYYDSIIERDLSIDDVAGWLFNREYYHGYVLIRHTTHDLSQATCESPAVCSFCGYVSESALGHDFADEYTIDVAATCTKVGEKSRHCSRCDKKADVTTIPMVEHAYNEGEVITSAGEYTDGKKKLTCTNCGATKVVAIPALGHTHSYGDYVYSSDKHYKECVCGDKIQVENHFYTVSTTVYATCTKEGTQKYECSTCGYFYNKSINKIAHAEVTDEAVAATCTKVGKTQGSHCSVCGKTIKAQTDIPAKGHTASDFYIDKQATCTQEGSKHKECTVCKTVLTTVSIPVIAHDYSTNYVKTKHENGHEGIAVYVCANCKFEDERKIAHVFDSAPVVIAPTCTTEGYTAQKCACGASSNEKYDIKPALGHDEVTNDCYLFETGATLCEQKYQTITTCKRTGCNYYVEGTVNEAKGHTYTEWTVAKAPTATQDGTITRKCSVCGLSTGDTFVETMPSFNSAEGKKLIDATTTNTNCLQSRNGKYTYTAKDGETFEYDVTIPAATAHKLANGEEISLTKVYELGAKAEKGDKTYGELGFDWAGNHAATCAKTGGPGLVKCNECRNMIIVTVKNSHQPPTEEDFANCGITCTKGGSCTYCCRKCEEEVTTEFQALGHNYSVELNPFVNSNGTYTANCKATCIRCDYIKEMANATVTIERQEATCNAPGCIKYTCVDKNGETLTAKEIIPQLKHCAEVLLVAGGTEKIEIDFTKVYDLNKYDIELSGNSNVTCVEGEAQGLIECLTCSNTYIVKVIAKHTAPAGYTYKTPTCQVQYDDFTCTVCGQSAHEAVEVLEHKYTYELKNIDASAKTATLVKTCTVGKEVTTENVTGLTSKVVREASCTVKELIRYTYTAATGETVSIDIEGDFAPHYLADGEAMVPPGNGKVYTVGDHGIEASGNTPAVCSSTGLGLAKCKVCHKTMIVDIKGPHAVNETTVDKKDPTCTDDGYYHYNCLNCGELVKDEVENPSKYKATGHKYSYTVKTEPTTNAKGELVGKCKTCDDEVSVELPKLNSTDYTVSPATCTVKETYTWNNKDYGMFVFEDKDGAVATHTKNRVIKEYSETTTNEKGEQIETDYVIYYCEKCGNAIREIVKVTVVG